MSTLSVLLTAPELEPKFWPDPESESGSELLDISNSGVSDPPESESESSFSVLTGKAVSSKLTFLRMCTTSLLVFSSLYSPFSVITRNILFHPRLPSFELRLSLGLYTIARQSKTRNLCQEGFVSVRHSNSDVLLPSGVLVLNRSRIYTAYVAASPHISSVKPL